MGGGEVGWERGCLILKASPISSLEFDTCFLKKVDLLNDNPLKGTQTAFYLCIPKTVPARQISHSFSLWPGA